MSHRHDSVVAFSSSWLSIWRIDLLRQKSEKRAYSLCLCFRSGVDQTQLWFGRQESVLPKKAGNKVVCCFANLLWISVGVRFCHFDQSLVVEQILSQKRREHHFLFSLG